MTRDNMRVDVGYIIQRQPIFLHMTEKDMKFIKYRSDLMQEYDFSMANYVDEFEEMSKLNEDILAHSPNRDIFNLDNQPTHRIYNDAGEAIEYCAGSKYFKLVDPNIDDPHNFHTASKHRIYLLLKNKIT